MVFMKKAQKSHSQNYHTFRLFVPPYPVHTVSQIQKSRLFGQRLTCAGAVGANRGVSQRWRAARVHRGRVVILGTAGLDGSQVAVAA